MKATFVILGKGSNLDANSYFLLQLHLFDIHKSQLIAQMIENSMDVAMNISFIFWINLGKFSCINWTWMKYEYKDFASKLVVLEMVYKGFLFKLVIL